MKEMVQLLCTHALILLVIANLTVSNYSSSNGAITASSISDQNQTANFTLAPLIFPKNDSKHHFVDNRTILENLAFHDSISGNNTEAEDLRHGGEYSKIETGVVLDPEKTPPQNMVASNIVNPKSQTELIENGSNTEDRFLNIDISNKGQLSSDSNYSGNSHGPGVPLVQGQLAAILAGVFVVLSVIGYIGLLSWRRFLENRYGNREMLVNEDDFNDPRDMGHFSL